MSRPRHNASALLILAILAACSPAPLASREPTTPASSAVTPPSEAGASEPSASPAGDTIDDRAGTTIAVDGGPDWPTEGFGSIWLLAPDSNNPSLVRLNPETNEEVVRIELPGRLCQGFNVTEDAVWVCAPEGVVRVDPETNAIAGSVSFNAPQVPVFGRLAVGAGSVWALGSDDVAPNTVMRIDPAAMTATPIALGHDAATIAFGFDAVWATAPSDGLLLRIDPATGAITEHASGLDAPYTIAVGPDSLWITLFGDDDTAPAPDDPTIARVDPADGSAIVEIATGVASGSLGGLWATEDAVWVRAPSRFLTRIDPASNEVVDVIEGPGSSGDVTVAFGSLWATAVEFNDVYRLEP